MCSTGCQCSWVSGKRIMHREQPWALFTGEADAGFIFYHLALYFARSFPDEFEIVPVCGSTDNPQPAKGKKVGILQAVNTKGDWTDKQKKAQEKLMEAFQFAAVTQILG